MGTRKDTAYDNGGAKASSTRISASQDQNHNDDHHARRIDSRSNQVKNESTADDGYYGVHVGNTRVYYEEARSDCDSGYGSNLGQSDRTGYGEGTGYSNNTRYRETYNNPYDSYDDEY